LKIIWSTVIISQKIIWSRKTESWVLGSITAVRNQSGKIHPTDVLASQKKVKEQGKLKNENF